ncbi:MAG: primosomal protein N', partial [Abitibacteriaceae bacterium]|nr:primosomal protein N' [Abditibacteriaceae bacterium]
YIEFTLLEQRRAPVPHMPPSDTRHIQLTSEQKAAVAAIEESLRAVSNQRSATNTESSSLSTILLQGVTASGKTEVYLNSIEHCLALGRRALVLVPEIALTAQTVEIFQRRFQERVAILHSAMSAGERFDEWRRVRSGRADIIVGARSAIFAPCRDVGLIIIDEEHDHSYKQDAMPRYHARDVALKRAALENAVLVLGTATPSLESYQHALKGDFKHIKMTQRIGTRRLPDVEIVDMTEEAKMGTLPVLSQRLKDALCETVARGEQAIVFLNRRGFATYVQCLGCGHVERCPNCDVTLTYHRRAQMLRCHHCDHAAPVLEECPQCKGWMIGFTGTGTEKVESEVAALLKERGLCAATVLRLDRDTTSQKGAHGKILGEFRQGKAQVLIGTQMVTKGLDFPKVTLVGVIAADTALNVPDFRAAERTFQLLAQVAGRAGRGEQPGRVLIQTLCTDHYAIESARSQDYEKFVEQEMELRKLPPYPPFSYVVNIIAQDEDAAVAQKRIQTLALQFQGAIEREGGATELLGPVDCPLSRVKGKYRFHLMLRDRSRPRLHRVLGVYDRLSRDAREGITIDVDAMTIM